MGRNVPDAKMYQYLHRTILELTEEYKFSELQVTGPLVQLTPLTANYDFTYFLGPQDQNPPPGPPGGPPDPRVQKVNSFFIFLDPYTPPNSSNYWTLTNSGYNLTFKTIDRMEVLMQVPSIPTNWTRFNQQIWIAATPTVPYYIFMRYQRLHPFPSYGTTNQDNDPIWMPDTWEDILEYATAQRLAQIYNLSDKATELNARLMGDQKFQETSGVEGQPGLIFRRTSDESRDQMTTVKRFRLRMGQR